MLICPACHHRLSGALSCSECSFVPAEVDGFRAWAPGLNVERVGYPEDGFEQLFPLEADSFWFRARNELLLWALGRYHPHFQSFMEVGCGTGFVLSAVVARFPRRQVVGTEVLTKGLRFAAKRLPDVELVQMDILSSPYVEEFDAVGAFDVLEHIRDDAAALEGLFLALKPGGVCLITVPQHQWLWSHADDAAQHERRYDSRELVRKVTTAKFEILRNTSFVALLLPLMMMSRLKPKGKGQDGVLDELRLPSGLNALFYLVMKIEGQLIRWGFNFPFGGSRLLVLRRPDMMRHEAGLA